MDDEEERVRSVYERYGQDPRRARAWSAENPGNALIREEVAAAVLERAGDLGDGDVLDVGCGSGWWLRSLGGLGVAPGRLHGADVLASRVEAAARAVPGAELRRADGRALPWPDDRFRLVTLFLVLSSQGDREIQRTTLREARRVLAPGGDLFVWEPRLPNPANRATRVVRRATLREALGPDLRFQAVTVLPALARRLGSSPAAYHRIARTRVLSTHRLTHLRKPGAGSGWRRCAASMRPVMWRRSLALAGAAGLALSACGGNKEPAAKSTATPKPGASVVATVPKGSDSSPGPTVRAFLVAYGSGDAKRSCAFVTSEFSRAENPNARPPESCTQPSDNKSGDPLTQRQTIIDTDPKPPIARVLTRNAKDSLLVFRLVRRGSGWRISSVRTQTRAKGGGKPKLRKAVG